MAAFSYQYPPFLVDSVLMSNTVKNQGLLDELFPNFNQICPLSGNLQQEGSSIDGSIHGSSCIEPFIVDEKQRSESLVSSMADVTDSGEQVTQNLAKKRRSRNGFSSDSANSKNVKQVKCKKHKGEKEAMKDVKNDKKYKNEATKEPPKGYIHVRARRGQATDSHSLAERVRREKINERMKMLQALVPGCDKVTGKALMLDEIINYVQSLQNQVEFLSLKLASLDPMVYTFGLIDMDPMTFGAQGMSNSMALVPPPPLIQSTTTSATTSNTAQPFSDTNAISSATASPKAATTTTSFPSTLVDTSASLLQQEQKQTVHPLQEGRSSYWGVLDDHQRQRSIINRFGFDTNSLYSLQ